MIPWQEAKQRIRAATAKARMKVRITGAAAQDLLDGHAFHERQQQGIGDYFPDSLYAGIHP